ncbi:hypothetical protein HK101_002137 [Irineochytrium annulatum]|nr:hypothetical protein HK101_002137 [Irineochytrium annulatum]
MSTATRPTTRHPTKALPAPDARRSIRKSSGRVGPLDPIAKTATTVQVASKPAMTVKQPATAKGDQPETLYRLIKQYRLSPDEFLAKYPATAYMITRMLGACFEDVTTLSMHAACITGFSVMISPMLDIPALDAGFGHIGVELRRQICVASAMVVQCNYCSAIFCAMGSAFSGGYLSNRDRPRLKLLPTDLPASSKAVLRLVVAATKIPSCVTPQMRSDVVTQLGEAALVSACKMMATAGFSITLKNILGVELEGPFAELATLELGPLGWEAGRHDPAGKSTLVNHPMSDPSRVPVLKQGRSCLTSCIGSNAFTRTLDLVRNGMKADLEHEPLLSAAGVPAGSITAQDAWLRKLAGYSPRFLGRFNDAVTRRALLFNLFAAVLADDADKGLPPELRPTLALRDRIAAAYVYYTAVGNGYMRCGIATLASHNGVPAKTLSDAVEVASSYSAMGPNGEETCAAALLTLTSGTTKRTLSTQLVMIAWLAARRMRPGLYFLVEDLPTLVADDANRGRTCVEVATVMGVLTLFHRLSCGLDDETGLEPEVKAVVGGEYGLTLKLGTCETIANGGLGACTDCLQPRATLGVGLKEGKPIWSGSVEY